MEREPSDAEVVKDVLNGNRERFSILLKRYKRYIFSIVARYVPPEHVEEVAQEAAVQSYLSLSGFRGSEDDEFRGWISKIAVRTAYAFWRERYKKKEMSMDSLREEEQRWMETVMGDISAEEFSRLSQQQEAIQVLDWALNRLSPKERMVLQLTALEEYSVKEAAEILGWSVPNVKVRAMRARRRLRKILEEAGEGK
jgi:RNA polymerase sigma-70 factor (ECF subfamily)